MQVSREFENDIAGQPASLDGVETACAQLGELHGTAQSGTRSGSTITGGLIIGLSHEDAARFSFLLATPIIAAAAFLKLPELTYSAAQEVLVPTLAGALAAGGAAYLAVRFLVRYFRTKTLTPFGVYCLLIGAGLSALFLVR